jgi:hypothetical protein
MLRFISHLVLLIRSFHTENSSLLESACVTYAKKLTHNLKTVNGWETYQYLDSSGYARHNITHYWNENQRFRQFNFTEVKICSIIYCGANTDGTDGMRFAREYSSCYIWFLEPVLSFYEQFIHSSSWKSLVNSNASGLYNAYPYGLANRSAFIDVAESRFSEGQSFSIIRKQQMVSSHERHKLVIQDVSEILLELKILKQVDSNLNAVNGELTLMHMNCEGCEYEVLERLIDTHLIKHVRYLQFGTHRPLPIQSTIAERYCSLQEKLSNTHMREFGIPWGWERWVLN